MWVVFAMYSFVKCVETACSVQTQKKIYYSSEHLSGYKRQNLKSVLCVDEITSQDRRVKNAE